MRILFYSDPHIADKPPLGRIDDYCTSIYEKLMEVRDMSADLGCAATVCTGDVFHQKRPNRVSHRLVNQRIYLFGDHLVLPASDRRPHLVVPGNHDLGPEGLSSLDKQPLGTLCKAEVLTVLNGPYLLGNVLLVGRPWDDEKAADPDYYVLTEEEKDVAGQFKQRPAVVMVAHGPILPPGAQRMYSSVNVTELPLEGIDVVMCGHIHEDLGIHSLGKKKDKHFANVGSISRISRTISNLSRGLFVTMLEVPNELDEADSYGAQVKLTRHGLTKVLPAGEVFEDRPIDEEGVSDEVQHFIGTVSAGLQAEELTLDEALAELGNLSDEAAQLAKKYLEEVGL